MYPDGRALLMVGETYNTADVYYVTRYLFPDPAIYLDKGDGASLIACVDFEHEGAKRSKAARVRGFHDYGADDLPRDMPDHERLAELTLRVLRAENISRAVTTDAIPLSVADHVRAHGVDLICQPDLLKARRERKELAELAAIESAQRAAERAMQAAMDLIAGSLVGDDGLLYVGDVPVTSERLRTAIAASLLEDNCSGEGTITAWGPDSAQPHNRGHGPIRAGQPIVVDIFPRHNEYRYHADMTRTFSKGAPDPEVARMYELTNAALDLALGLIRPGTTGRAVFEAVCRHYEDHGYASYLRNNCFPEAGFIHSLGHGVGLSVHEGPRLGRPENGLRAGEIITVEPGLYVPGLGGVRIEDMVVVTADGCRNLTVFPKTLVL
jgi:Xaa-Pro aminopeptidase